MQTIVTPDDPSLSATIDTNGFDVSYSSTGSIAGSGALMVLDSSGGQGTLDLTGADTSGLLGNLVIAGGFVAADGMNCLGSSGTVAFDGGGLRWSGPFNIPASEQIEVLAGGATFDVNGFAVEIDATIGCTSSDPDGADGGVTVMDGSGSGTGVLTLTNGNICQAGTTIAGGTLAIGSDADLGASGVPLTFSGGTLQATGPLTLADNEGNPRPVVTPDDPTLAAIIDSNGNAVTVPGPVSGAGGLTAIDTSGTGGTLTLSGANNTYSGVTIVGSPTETLVLGNGLALQQSTFDTSGPGTLNLNGCTALTFGGLQGSGDFSLPGGYSLTVGGNGYATTLSGVLSGGGSLCVAAPGGVVLTADNSGFAGTVTVLAGGFLEAISPAALPGYVGGSGTISTESGGTLAVAPAPAGGWRNRTSTGSARAAVSPAAQIWVSTREASRLLHDDTALDPSLGLVVLGNGTLVLTGNNSGFSAGLTVVGATVQFASTAPLGDGTAPITLDGGTLQAADALNLSAPIVLNPGGGTIDVNGFAVTVTSAISGTGPLTVIDSSGGSGAANPRRPKRLDGRLGHRGRSRATGQQQCLGQRRSHDQRRRLGS